MSTNYLIDGSILQVILNNLESVLCDPEGRVCIRGSETDRSLLDVELETLRKILAAPLANSAVEQVVQNIPMVTRPGTGRTIPDLTGIEHVCKWQRVVTANKTN